MNTTTGNTMDSLTDDDLMKLVQRRDQTAVSSLIRRYRADVLEFCDSIAPGNGEYRTEEVFYVAMKCPRSIRSGENVGAWLVRIAQHADKSHKVRGEFAQSFANAETDRAEWERARKRVECDSRAAV